MAFNIFLNIEGIPGECMDSKHKGWIDVLSFRYGVKQTQSHSIGGGGGAGRPQLQELFIIKAIDKASPKFFEACATGLHVKSVSMEVCQAAGNLEKFMEIKLSDSLVSSYQPSTQSGGASPTEEISFNYSKIEFTVATKRPDGSLGEPRVTTGFDTRVTKPPI